MNKLITWAFVFMSFMAFFFVFSPSANAYTIYDVKTSSFENPVLKSIQYDDRLSNTVFDIKTDKNVYSTSGQVTVYIAVTNLTNSKQDLNLGLFLNRAGSVDFFGEWTTLTRTAYDYNVFDLSKEIPLADLNGFTCESQGLSSKDSKTCIQLVRDGNVVLEDTRLEDYNGWKESKAQQWKNPNPISSKNGFDPKGSLNGINIGKNETKYFLLVFTMPFQTKGEFLICGNDDCLDPWWDSTYTVRYPVNIGTTHSAIDTNYTFALTGFPTTVSNCFDKNSLAVVWSNSGVSTPLNADVNGVCGGDFNVFWKSKFGIPLNTALNSSDTNGYFIYLKSSQVLNALRDINEKNVYLQGDTFADGDMNNPQWYDDTSGLFANSNILVSTGGFDDSFFIATNQQTDVNWADNGGIKGLYSYWINIPDGTSSPRFVLATTAGNAGYVNTRNVGNAIQYFDTAYKNFSPSVVLTTGVWYKIEAVYIDNNTLIDYFVYDAANNLITSALNVGIQSGKQGDAIGLKPEGGGGTAAMFDRFVARKILSTEPVLSLGTAESQIPDLNLSTPNGNNYFSIANANADGNQSIDFNVSSPDNNYLRIQIYRSTTRGAFTTQIIDQNLSYIAQNPSADMNCGAASIDFTSQRVCHIDYNIMYLYSGDGNFFLDLNVATYSTDLNKTAFSSTAFVIDTNKPVTTWDGNAGSWQRTDANVHLTCVDTGGCDSTKLFYRRDSDATSSVSLGAVTLFDKNVLFRIANGDGNFRIDFNATDLAGNTSDLNTQYVLLDNTTPIVTKLTPVSNQNIATQIFTFSYLVNDGNGSSVSTCDYNAYVNNTVIVGQQNQTVAFDPNSNTCSFSFAYTASATNVIDVNLNVVDGVGLRSSTVKSNSFTYVPVANIGGGGGGGGGGGPIIIDLNVVTPQLLILSPSTKILDLAIGQPKDYFITVTSTSEQIVPMTIDLDLNFKNFAGLRVSLPDGSELPFSDSLSPRQTKVYKFTIIADQNFEDTFGYVLFNINSNAISGVPQSVQKVDLTIRKARGGTGLFGLDLSGSVFGLPILLILLLIGGYLWVSRSTG